MQSTKFQGGVGLSVGETTVSGGLPPEYYKFNAPTATKTTFQSKMDSILIARKPNVMYQSFVILGHGKIDPRLFLRRLILTPTELTVMNEDMSKETKIYPVSNILDVHWFREKRFSLVLRSLKNENRAKRLRKRSSGVKTTSPDICSKTIIIETGHPAITARWVNYIKKACGVAYDAKLLGETGDKQSGVQESEVAKKLKSKSTDNASGVTKRKEHKQQTDKKKFARSNDAVPLYKKAASEDLSSKQRSVKGSNRDKRKSTRPSKHEETERDRKEREAAMKVSGRRRGSQSMIIHRRPSAVADAIAEPADSDYVQQSKTPRGTETRDSSSSTKPELRRSLSSEFTDPLAVGSPASVQRREYWRGQRQSQNVTQNAQHAQLTKSAPQQLPTQQQPQPILFDPFAYPGATNNMSQSLPAIPLSYTNPQLSLQQQQQQLQAQQLHLQQQMQLHAQMQAQQQQLMMNPFLLPSTMLPIGMPLPPLSMPVYNTNNNPASLQQQQQQQQLPMSPRCESPKLQQGVVDSQPQQPQAC
eukprot:TRINITY_DN1054_c0_g1_i1.p1 TRINITY_DN1054_c0_g1~~TRINITY_DN1054_c0_g1_i1.p1  ORF type:complete len:530 (-),score=129.44 TRINITY_DN1054_c0_g1_i1:67-1656(-)